MVLSFSGIESAIELGCPRRDYHRGRRGSLMRLSHGWIAKSLMIFNRLLIRCYLFVSLFRRGMTLGVRAAVFDARGPRLSGQAQLHAGLVPARRRRRAAARRWSEALDRELGEEGGIRLAGAGDAVRPLPQPARHRRATMSRSMSAATGRQPEPPKVPNLEIVACGFFAPDALPEGTPRAPAGGWPRSPARLPPAGEW